MRELFAPLDKREYEQRVWEEVFPYPELKADPFYSRLINWVIDHRAPIYSSPSHPSERLGFSMMHGLCTLRPYQEPYRRMLFLLHDHTHLLFPVPHRVRGVSEPQFVHAFTRQERLASNESEVLAHYRLPWLRERVFPAQRLWVDLLKEQQLPQPPPAWLLARRAALISRADFRAELLAGEEELAGWMAKWDRLLTPWCEQRYRVLSQYSPPSPGWRWLGESNYQQEIMSYGAERRSSQAEHQRLLLANLRMICVLAGRAELSPASPAQIPRCLAGLEDGELYRAAPDNPL